VADLEQIGCDQHVQIDRVRQSQACVWFNYSLDEREGEPESPALNPRRQ
jgi:hypothetical protein